VYQDLNLDTKETRTNKTKPSSGKTKAKKVKVMQENTLFLQRRTFRRGAAHQNFQYKISRPNSITYLNQTPLFEWCVIRCESKDGHQKDMCSEEIELHAPYLLTILGSEIINILGRDLCGLLMALCQWTLIIHTNCTLAPKLSGIVSWLRQIPTFVDAHIFQPCKSK
jgi:hypothetical protein